MPSAALSTGVTIEYEVHGSGEPLLLVMGLGGQLVSWPDSVVGGLVDRGFQVIVFDNRDIGLSTKGATPPPTIARSLAALLSRRFATSEYLLSDMADDAVGLLDHLQLRRAHIVGISMGGMIAQTIAINHPTRAKSLTSIMSTTGSRRVGQPRKRNLLKLLKLTKGGADTAVERNIEVFRIISGSSFDEAETCVLSERAFKRNYDPDGVARQAAAIAASPDRTPALRTLRLPALVVHGLQDTLVGPSGGFATTAAIPGARMLVFPDMGHNIPAVRGSEIFDAIVHIATLAGFQPEPATREAAVSGTSAGGTSAGGTAASEPAPRVTAEGRSHADRATPL